MTHYLPYEDDIYLMIHAKATLMTMNVYPPGFEDLYQAHPLTLVDVGASGGRMPLWEPHRQHLRIIGFEPDDRAFEALRNQQNSLIHYFNIGLHRQSGEFDFYLTRKQKNFSCLSPTWSCLIVSIIRNDLT